ncbi:hypothetical protein LWI29_003318 [Acer saccharum]|uniref:Uncharacterized protein n=1 Tax=Acer saccharum TaxID=4024 RepID=A0AA39VQ99_ACESA|nr:hypothetical protein LWI29_003318 [Acer saccharum]
MKKPNFTHICPNLPKPSCHPIPISPYHIPTSSSSFHPSSRRRRLRLCRTSRPLSHNVFVGFVDELQPIHRRFGFHLRQLSAWTGMAAKFEVDPQLSRQTHIIEITKHVLRPSKLLQECQNDPVRPTETSLHQNIPQKFRKRPYFGEFASDFKEIGAVAIEHDCIETPPLAISFCKTSKNSHLFAVSDEDGCMNVFDSRKKFTSFASHHDNTDLVVSGSRDGSFNIWDLRCNNSSKSRNSEVCIGPSAAVKGAHLSSQAKRIRRGKAASMSITSVLYLKDEVSIATAGAVNSVVKFWDTRNLKAHVTQACPYPESSTVKERRLHGISSLSQDLNGVFLTASCMDNRIYLYNVLQLEKGPIQSFSGCQIESFYVKSAISPDADHILSGSSNGNAYIWQVNKPQVDPIVLKSHDGEVTAVDWCPSEAGKIATASDDFTVRIWNTQSSYCSSTRSPASIRRRVMAIPSAECRKLLMDEEVMDVTKTPGSSYYEVVHQTNSSNPIQMPIITTPDAQKKRASSISDSTQLFEKTPEAASNSPSSVLNPPSSVKRRTIRDYFLVAP